MTNELTGILQKIKEHKAILNVEVEDGSPTSRNMRDKQSNAKIRLEELTLAYRNSLVDRTVFIVLYGKGATELSQVAEKEFGSYAADAEQSISRIVSEIPESQYLNKNGNAALIEAVTHAIEGLANEAGINSYPQPVFKSSEHGRRISSKEDMHGLVKHILAINVGSEMVAIHAVTATHSKAMDTDFDGRVYPVVLHTEDETYAKILVDDITNRLERQVFTIATEETAPIDKETLVLKKNDKTSLKSVFTAIKKNLGGK
jgi:hypothetical protein